MINKAVYAILISLFTVTSVQAQEADKDKIIGTWVAVSYEFPGVPVTSVPGFEQLQIFPNGSYTIINKKKSSDSLQTGAYDFVGGILICYKSYNKQEKIERSDTGYYSREYIKFLSKSRMQCTSISGGMVVVYAKMN